MFCTEASACVLERGVSLHEHFCAVTPRTSPAEEVWQPHARLHTYASSRETRGQRLWGKASQSTKPRLTGEKPNTVLWIYHFSPSTRSQVRRILIPWRWCWRRIPMLGTETRMQGRAWCKLVCAEPQSAAWSFCSPSGYCNSDHSPCTGTTFCVTTPWKAESLQVL